MTIADPKSSVANAALPHTLPNRWIIAVAGTLLQVCLGTAYAWSYFQNPLRDAFGWTNSLTAWAFCLAICFLGLAAAVGGMLLPKVGPARLAMIGGFLFGAGYLLGAWALHLQSPLLLFLSYGVIGGCGLGLGYVTPVATVAKWFPDKKGLATGMVIMGFGLGALVMSKFFAPLLLDYFSQGIILTYKTQAGTKVLENPQLLQDILAKLFIGLGILFTILTVPLGFFLRNPPKDYAPRGWQATQVSRSAAEEDGISAWACILSGRFWIIWAIFFANITAGIAIIGFQSPLFQDLWHSTDPTLSSNVLASYGATLIGITALFNGLGRFFWGSLSDKIGRRPTFTIMLASQIGVFALLAYAVNPWLFALLLCYVLLCYGGGFGAMPAFIMDVFGVKRMAVVYGVILTAWSAAGIVGPQMVAQIKDHYPDTAGKFTFLASAGFVAVGAVLSLFASSKPFAKKTT